MAKRKINMGMVGGGPGSFIGRVHYMAAILDGQIDLVCGSFSSNPEKSKVTGAEYYLAPDRVYDTYQAVVILQLGFSTPVCVWLMIGYIKKGCPREFEESAMIDGCTILQTLFRIVLPLAMPGVVTVFLFVFLLSWGDLLIPLTFVGSDFMQTVPLAIASILEQGPGGSPPWDLLMAISVLYSLPIIVIAFVLQKYVVKGLLSGGIKF